VLRIPVWSLTLLGLAALIVSLAAVPADPVVTAALLALSVALVVAFVMVDRRATATVLPRAVFVPGPLKWIYLTLGLLMAATMVDMYVPLFGQRLAGLTPVIAGFLGAALSVGWTFAEIRSASINRRPVAARVVTLSPLVMAAGLGLAGLAQQEDAGPAAVALWAVALVITGAGIGGAWPHLSVWAMGSGPQEGAGEPGEQAVASAAVNTVQLICGAFGAGLAGVVVNLRDSPDATAARWLFALFAGLAALGVLASSRASRQPAN
jgi:MFS family permease